ncbi:DinB family protein [Falsibacillus albus]|uniref:DinB family protein n=1 Tax=Falsibacillus albus TaxID=2478915 RepID=A0A3L7K4G5_9BACI|nr:DinB family protein [Falsibacillus albus]RLQ97169.1 DinB family protein [Falsibacillus albus]
MDEIMLDQIRNDLLKSFSDVQVEKLNEQPEEGKWSIAQVVLHLAGAEKRFLQAAFKAVEEKKISYPKKVDLSVFDDPEVKMKAPIDPKDDYQTKADLVEALSNSRALTKDFLSRFSEGELEGYCLDHHRFGEMPAWQIFELLGRHERHHINQINQIKQAVR